MMESTLFCTCCPPKTLLATEQQDICRFGMHLKMPLSTFWASSNRSIQLSGTLLDILEPFI